MDSPYACGPPPPEAAYADLDTTVATIQGYAQRNGYALCKRDSTPSRIIYTCDRFSKPQTKGRASYLHPSKRRPGSSSKKCRCAIKRALKQDAISGHWALSILEGTHNYESSADIAAYPIYRTAALDPEVIAQIRSLSASSIRPAQILTVVRQQFPRAILVQKDVSNIIQKARLEQFGGRTPMQ